MQPGDVARVDTGACTDIYYVETGMYDTTEYGTVYILDGPQPAIVDSGLGPNYEYVLDALETIGIEQTALTAILLTHVHLDHAGGAGFIAEQCPNATVYAHERGAPYLSDPEPLVAGTKNAVKDQWQYYVDPVPIPETRITAVTDGDTIDLGSRRLQAHHAPGHALHQVVYESPTDDAVFVGDAAGIYIPTYDRVQVTSPPATFNREAVLEDAAMIAELDPETLLYPHFGPAPKGDRLDRYQQAMTEWVDTVAQRRAQTHDDTETLAAYFAARVDQELIDIWGEHKAREEIKLNVRGVCQYLEYREEHS